MPGSCLPHKPHTPAAMPHPRKQSQHKATPATPKTTLQPHQTQATAHAPAVLVLFADVWQVVQKVLRHHTIGTHQHTDVSKAAHACLGPHACEPWPRQPHAPALLWRRQCRGESTLLLMQPPCSHPTPPPTRKVPLSASSNSGWSSYPNSSISRFSIWSTGSHSQPLGPFSSVVSAEGGKSEAGGGWVPTSRLCWSVEVCLFGKQERRGW